MFTRLVVSNVELVSFHTGSLFPHRLPLLYAEKFDTGSNRDIIFIGHGLALGNHSTQLFAGAAFLTRGRPFFLGLSLSRVLPII